MNRVELPSGLAEALGSVRTVGVVTGAGISAESGIQPYRGKGGLYDDPVEGDRTVEALSGPTLVRDPDRTWKVVAGLAARAAEAQPNPGHHALVRIEDSVDRFVLLTQNVDGLHRRAGSRNLIDIHGSVFATRCFSCQKRGELDRETLPTLDRAPRCDRCDGVLRPDAVLFGERLPEEKVARIRRELEEEVPDLVIAVGTTAVFSYIQLPVLVAQRQGRLTVEINPESTVLSERVAFRLQGAASDFLPALAERIGAKEQ